MRSRLSDEPDDRTSRLLAAEQHRFELEYARHYMANESKPRSIGQPYLLHHPTAKVGVLLVHGLMAAPEEVRQWADYLYAQGYSVYAPRMAGHGTSVEDLAQRSAGEWIDSVQRGYDILQGCCQQIVAAGFSTGGAVMLQQVIQQPKAFAALISISAPLKFKKFSARFARPVCYANQLLRAAGLARFTREFVTNHADNPHINYLRCPISSIAQIQTMMAQVYLGLPSIRIPALIIHAKRDPKVAVQSGRGIHARLGSAHKRYHEIAFRQHGIVRGEIAQQVFAQVGEFLEEVFGVQ